MSNINRYFLTNHWTCKTHTEKYVFFNYYISNEITKHTMLSKPMQLLVHDVQNTTSFSVSVKESLEMKMNCSELLIQHFFHLCTRVYPEVTGCLEWELQMVAVITLVLLSSVCLLLLSQFSEFCHHNHLCYFSMSVCCCLFCSWLSPETFGYTLVSFTFIQRLHILNTAAMT
jgi:hypothetical protein